MEQADEMLLVGLDTNVVACVLAHLSPPDLARVEQTCRALGREAASDVVWCTLFLRRFGSDFWGEAVGLHPYLPAAVPPERNEWPQHRVSELYALFSARTPKPASGTASVGEDDADGLVPPLLEFVKQHAAPTEGYGGWKLAYRRMHEMVTEWTRPADEGIIVAGLVPFATLSALADSIKLELSLGLGDKPTNRNEGSQPPVEPAFDVTSPGGECRVLRVEGYHNIYYSSRNGKTTTTNISVIRKPRHWYCADKQFFRGLRTTLSSDVKIIYVVDAQKMSDSEDHAERTYRELHGMLGEGKGRFEEGLAVVLFLINTVDPDHVKKTLARLKVPEFVLPNHWCPYYAGPVIFIAAPLKPKKVRRALKWLLKQPSSRPHWDARGFLLCALQGSKGSTDLFD